ncbi:MAG: molybdopterin-dependent oxidoreductase [Actinomycetota bacterium]|nr:molybdopterin-dependent oxidoreductase [Actinomycetota bacterium]
MAGRRTNLALFGLLGVAFATGALAFGVGTEWANRAVVVAHGLAGLAIVALAPWKSLIARRGLRRERAGRAASLVFSVLVVLALAFGFLHSTGLAVRLGPVSAMQLHVGAALVALPLAGWHVLARRVPARPADLSRRNLLRGGALLGMAGLAYASLEGLMRAGSWPGAERRFTGSHETGSFRPSAMPVTQWLDDTVPQMEPDGWRLEVGASAGRRSWTYQEVNAFADRLQATLDCTGGWFATQEWEGALLERLLPPGAQGGSLLVRSVTGYARRLPVGDLPHLLLATRVGGEPLSAGHGFPARLVVPGRRGFWWVKWVVEVVVDDRPWWAQLPFPLT